MHSNEYNWIEFPGCTQHGCQRNKKEQFYSMGQFTAFIWKWSVPLTSLHKSRMLCYTIASSSWSIAFWFDATSMHVILLFQRTYGFIKSSNFLRKMCALLNGLFFISFLFIPIFPFSPLCGERVSTDWALWTSNWRLKNSIFDFCRLSSQNHLFRVPKVWTFHTQKELTAIEWDAAAFEYRVNDWNFITFLFLFAVVVVFLFFFVEWKSFNLSNLAFELVFILLTKYHEMVDYYLFLLHFFSFSNASTQLTLEKIVIVEVN